MNLKKLAALGLTLALCAGLAAGCSNSGSGSGTAATPAPVDTPTPASTESEMLPAMLFRMMADTTASPERNMEEEPTLTTW